MPEEYLQVAFEIKASCDEISRRLLRWHWEQKPGSHTLESLLEHLEQRKKESPVYYDRLPDLGQKTSWQQLDTTLCMRVLLDPEKDAAHPLDLLGSTPRPSAARRACNAVRTARNEAAHAADRSGGAQAAILFNEAVECLEEGYAGTAFREQELAGYYRQAEEYLARCSGNAKPAKPAPAARTPTAGRTNTAPVQASAKTKSTAAQKTGTARTKSSAAAVSRSSGRKNGSSGSKKRTKQTNKRTKSVNKTVLVLMLLALAVGLLLRAGSMGLLPFGR